MKSRIPLRDEELSGWGGYGGGRCRVACPRDAGEVAALFTEARRVETTLAFRGAGYSYSDAALNRAAIVVDMTAMCRILAWDAKTGLVTAQPGVTFAQLWRTLLPDGWWPNVAPDASAVTLGGAGAANIAGTNGWHAGFFGDTVLSLDLLLPSGATLICDRERNAEVFNAAIGGLGLFGCITALTLQARRVHSGNMWEISSAHPTLSELVEALEGAAEWATSLVAWIDPQARGGHLGRGILRAARDLAPDEEPHPATTLALAHQLPAPSRAARVWEATHLFRLPEPLAGRLARRGQWRRGQGINRRRPHLQTSVAATFTRDDVAVRRSILAPHGLVAHQSFLPRDTAIETIRGLLVRAQVAEHVPSLALLKKHRASDFLLTPLPAGYSLTLEIPLRPGGEARAQALLRDLNTIVIEAGGCCSLATDSAANAEQARRMIGEQRLARFREVKAQSDPDGLLCTDLYRRVIAPGGASSGQSAAKRSKAATTSRAMPATASGMRKVRKR